jgi:aldose 1-epimerase
MLNRDALVVAAATVILWTFSSSVAARAPGAGDASQSQGRVERMDFGKTPEGTSVELYILTNGRMTAKVMTYGATLTELMVPDRNGKAADVVLGFDSLDGYLAGHPYFGTTTGRVANRIAKGRFTLDGTEYKLAVNNPPNTLHGGLKALDKVVWKAKDASGPEGPAVRLSYQSPDGDEGFPGNLSINVTYTVTGDNALKIEYSATTDKATPVNLTNHSYFNLAGPASGPILEHELLLAADQYTPVDDTMIPTGELKPVQGTPLDFTSPAKIGARIGEIKGDPGGYDHNYVIKGGGKALALAARVYEPTSGRVLEMYTTEPGVQFYTANFLDGSLKGKGGVVYGKRQAFCLEAQHFPDSVNHPEFPSTILRPGENYTQTTIYKFRAR